MSSAAAPTIAAIIPLYNGEGFIAQAIHSVLGQSRPPDECIVVDDGSSDGGAAIVADLSERYPVRLLRKTNGGQSSARNHGVARSHSSHIAFLDQDDAWYPDHLAKLVVPFETRSADRALGWVYSDLDEADEAGAVLTRRFLRTRRAKHPKSSVADCLRDDMFVLPSASLIARHAFEAVGGYDERLSGYEDDDLFVRLLDHGFDNVFIDEPLSLWRIYAFSTSYSPRMARSRMIFARKALDLFGDRPDGHGGTLAASAIAPRFAKSLFGEYARAARRNDADAMTASLDDLTTVLAPRLPLLTRTATWLLATAFRFHPFGRLATAGRFGIARRIFRLPVDHRAAALQAQADKARG